MALGTGHRLVHAGQREISFTVVEYIGCIPVRMASQASRAVVGIAIYAAMLVVGSGICMAGSTGIIRIIRRVIVTIRTLIPCALVGAAVNGEIINIVLRVFRRHPIGVGCMALGAILGKMRQRMVGLICCFIVRLMA